MIAINRETNYLSILLTAIVATIVVATLPSISHADAWELRTVDKEVPGTREIESGRIEKGIQISKFYLTRIPSPYKVALLTNLCIGYILMDNFAKAEHYCDRAVARKFERAVTHNNRGVLQALQGNVAAAQSEFSTAAEIGCDAPCSTNVKASGVFPRQVARRNLQLAESRLLASQKTNDTEQVASQTNQ